MEQIEFHTSVIGFNKAEVMSYISKIVQEKDEAVKEWQKKLDEQQQQSAGAKEELERKLAQKERETEELRREKEALASKMSELCGKEKAYTSAVESVGAALLTIKNTSDSLLKETKEKIDSVSLKFLGQKEKTQNEIISLKKVLENANTVVNETVVGFSRQLGVALDSLENVLESLEGVRLAGGELCFAEGDKTEPV